MNYRVAMRVIADQEVEVEASTPEEAVRIAAAERPKADNHKPSSWRVFLKGKEVPEGQFKRYKVVDLDS